MVLGDGDTYGPIEGCKVVVVPDHLMGEELDAAVKVAYECAEDIQLVRDEGLFIIHKVGDV
jgi:hypothetical protein